MAEFKLPPVSPLGGTTILNFFRVLRGKKISTGYYSRIPITIILILFCSLFHWIDKLYFRLKKSSGKSPEPPVFILGHWRSGTTLLHNLMTQDPAAAFVTTYHAVFPNNLKSQWLFRPLMRTFMPDVRPGDNLKLAVYLPQEDEYAISNVTHRSYYHVFYFPSSYREYYRDYVRFEDASTGVVERWNRTYKNIVKRAVMNSTGSRPVLKNPVNTGRIRNLTRIFPDASYIFIMRNPIITYLSSKKFFSQLYPTVNLEEFSTDEIVEMVLEIYVNLLSDYLRDRELIEPKRLLEIRYEEFELNPLEYLQQIYSRFGFNDFDKALPAFTAYLLTQKDHKMNGYKIKRKELDLVLEKLGFAMKHWNYEIPDDLVII
jgi:omega-hydroxy-beta-dihydromenaquinone-9 sulfotransferase